MSGAQFPSLAALPQGGPEGVLGALGATGMRLLTTTVAVFALVAGADVVYQRMSFAKKMRMSKRDLRQEGKEAEGDPMLKARRRQLHQEWSSRNVVEAARGATALVMSPWPWSTTPRSIPPPWSPPRGWAPWRWRCARRP